jgi:hypothetical protein
LKSSALLFREPAQRPVIVEVGERKAGKGEKMLSRKK